MRRPDMTAAPMTAPMPAADRPLLPALADLL